MRALAIMNVSVANSTVLAIVRKYEETSLLTAVQLIDVMRLVENFHFQFTALTNSGQRAAPADATIASQCGSRKRRPKQM